jgi:DNA repair exonuclease SbcCD ATPase subunit
LKDILNEVRQLRADLLRLNVNAHRTQALLDRMKVQQEQVVRLTREVGNVRDELISIRNRQTRAKDAVEHLEKQKAVELVGLAGERELKAMTSELEELKQREQVLVEREPVISADLDSTRATLANLNARLDELEREIATPPASQWQPKKN